MSVKTIAIIICTTLTTVLMMQNVDEVPFSILFWDVHISKMLVMTSVAVLTFFVGLIAGKMAKKDKLLAKKGDPAFKRSPADSLTEEDKSYINE